MFHIVLLREIEHTLYPVNKIHQNKFKITRSDWTYNVRMLFISNVEDFINSTDVKVIFISRVKLYSQSVLLPNV